MATADMIKFALQFSHNAMMPLAEDLKDAPLTFPTPNGGNHALWVMGHLACARTGLLSMVTGEADELKDWGEHFQGGTTPHNDAEKYPAYEDVLAAYNASLPKLLAAVDQYADQLDEAPQAVPEGMREHEIFSTIGKLLLFIAIHDTSHRGQLADARKALGRDPVMF